MITVTILNKQEMTLNPFQIETIESIPDTKVTMMNGRSIYIVGTVEEFKEKVNNWFSTYMGRK